jgi:hypothetical protein
MPTAFVCHASEDKPIAEPLARTLMAAGIDTFFDKWEIRAGDSLRQRIDQGIAGCTHFLVILSPHSINKPWVNAELDAGFVARLEGHVRLIPLRRGLAVSELPPLLRGMLSPAIDDLEDSLPRLIADIHGVTERPTLGAAPPSTQSVLSAETGLSLTARRLAAHFVTTSERGRRGDPRLTAAAVRDLLGVPDDDIAEAVDELASMGWSEPLKTWGCGPIGFGFVGPTSQLFASLDAQLMAWNPETDARALAAEILNSPGGGAVSQVLDGQLGWGPRRMNPAITILVDRGVMDHSNMIDPLYVYYSLRKRPSSRRFLTS